MAYKYGDIYLIDINEGILNPVLETILLISLPASNEEWDETLELSCDLKDKSIYIERNRYTSDTSREVLFKKRMLINSLEKDKTVYIHDGYVLIRDNENNFQVFDHKLDMFLENPNIRLVYADEQLYMLIYIKDGTGTYNSDVVIARSELPNIKIDELYSLRQQRKIPIYKDDNLSFQECLKNTLRKEVIDYIVDGDEMFYDGDKVISDIVNKRKY